MNYKYIIAIDPAGNFEEGKGTTGVCVLESKTKTVVLADTIRAKQYKSKEEYWNAHLLYISDCFIKYPNSIVVMEDFTLNPRKALQQSHSKMETSKLIGVIQHHLMTRRIPLKMQLPVEAKSRWPDSILEYKHILKRVNRGHTTMSGQTLSKHEKDAIRHAVHYSTFYNKRK